MNANWLQLSPRYQVILAGICALILTVGIARFAYTPFLPIMLTETSLNKLSGGWLATFNYIGYLSGVVLISFLTSLKTKFLFYRINLVLAVLSTILMAVTTDIVLWSILRFIGGLTSTAGIILAAGFV
ncbi:MAG TPA: MFS transporter, partial [Methylophaga sp.]|nr:MFS transporter [Methylophaga sp.]